jgi:hypothetical protein
MRYLYRNAFYRAIGILDFFPKFGLPTSRFQAFAIAFTCVFVSTMDFPNFCENPNLAAHLVIVDGEQPISSAACFEVIMLELYAIAGLIANATGFESGRDSKTIKKRRDLCGFWRRGAQNHFI